MRRRPVVLALLIASACASHPSPATAPIRHELVSDASVRAHLEFLASDAMNGRGSGTRDEQIAAEYVAAEFHQLGLEAAGDDTSSGHRHVQAIEIERRSLTGPPALVAGSPDAPMTRWTHGKEILEG